MSFFGAAAIVGVAFILKKMSNDDKQKSRDDAAREAREARVPARRGVSSTAHARLAGAVGAWGVEKAHVGCRECRECPLGV